MEVCFDSDTKIIYKECFRQVKRVQEYAESVVPDTNDDIAAIASVQTAIFLKSKDVTARGVTVSGEVTAALLYITEDGETVSSINLSRQFAVEYEITDIDAETAAHILLSTTNSEARILNPRKVSVMFDICAELSCYRQSKIRVDTMPPEHSGARLHARFENREICAINAVNEKTFIINEQLAFPSGKPAPSKLISQRADFAVTDTQLIGTKIVLKGNMYISICYLSGEVNYPLQAEFTVPFSQIADIGAETMDCCTAFFALNSAYYDITEAVNGEKLLDAEIHAVVQLVSRYKQQIRFVTDMYCNRFPVQCGYQNSEINDMSELMRLKLSADERISAAEDCEDVLSVFTSILQPTQQQSRISAVVCFDIVYRRKSGRLSAVRRTENLEGEIDAAAFRLTGVRLSDVYLRPDGAYIDAHISMEVLYQSVRAVNINTVESVTLDTDAPYEYAKYPTVSLVRAENESVWELAKAYHSSTDVIEAMNDIGGGYFGKLLLIPKAD